MTGSHDWFSHGALAVLGTGHALPGDPVDTQALFAKMSPHAPELSWRTVNAVAGRLGIKTRHFSRAFIDRREQPNPGARNPDVAARAVSNALRDAGLRASDLGYLIGHSATPALPLPPNIALVADTLGYAGPYVELRQACTGFANALMIAFGLLAHPGARPVAIVGSETGSLFFDPAMAAGDHGQCVNMVQMGDGAGAIILGPAGASASSLRSAWFGTTGLGRTPGLQMREGGSDCSAPADHVMSFHQDFSAIAAAGPALFAAGLSAAAAQGLSPVEADWIIPHQASGKIGQQLAKAIAVDVGKVFVNANRVGNTGSAAIWIALAELRAAGLAAGSKTLVLGAEATKYMHGGFHYQHG